MIPVLFLDFDGPLFPERGIGLSPPISEYPSKLKLHPFISYWEMDRTSVRQLNSLYDIYPFDTVVSSSWKNFVEVDQVVELFQVNGLNLHLHENWCTTSKMTSQRHQEISMWLDDYTVNDVCPDHIILDDPMSGSSLDGGVHKLMRFSEPVFINPDVGIDTEAFIIMNNRVTLWASEESSIFNRGKRVYSGVGPLAGF